MNNDIKSISVIQTEVFNLIKSSVKDDLPSNFDYDLLFPLASFVYNFNLNIQNLAIGNYSFYQFVSGYNEGFVFINDVINIDKNYSQTLNIRYKKNIDNSNILIFCGPSSIESSFELSIAHSSNLYVNYNIFDRYNKKISELITLYLTQNLNLLKEKYQKEIDNNTNFIFNIIFIIKQLNIKDFDIHLLFEKEKHYSSKNIFDIISKNNEFFNLSYDLNFENNLKEMKTYVFDKIIEKNNKKML